MARIFTVSFTREFQVNVVAESADEIEKAFAQQTTEFDDWAGDAAWDVSVVDNLKHIKKAEDVPRTFAVPEMAIHKGEGVHLDDYKKDNPDWMARVEEDASKLALSLNIAKTVPKLPGIE